jgi:hypothetical protein
MSRTYTTGGRTIVLRIFPKANARTRASHARFQIGRARQPGTTGKPCADGSRNGARSSMQVSAAIDLRRGNSSPLPPRFPRRGWVRKARVHTEAAHAERIHLQKTASEGGAGRKKAAAIEAGGGEPAGMVNLPSADRRRSAGCGCACRWRRRSHSPPPGRRRRSQPRRCRPGFRCS